jgi:PAS domain S-box-containing protein
MTPDATLFQLLAEQVKDYAVFLIDPEGRVMSWNAGAQLIKGYRAEEIIGQHFSIFYTEIEVRNSMPGHGLRIAATEGRFEDNNYRVRKDGSRFWANVVITALHDKDGKLVAFSKITRDLTERRRHDETLRQSEERFRLLIEGVLDYAIFMLDTDGKILTWNTGAERIKGYKSEEIIGKHFSIFYPSADVESETPAKELAIARRASRVENEGWRLRKNGEQFWARVVISALRDSEGQLCGFAKVTQDLTQRMAAMKLRDRELQLHWEFAERERLSRDLHDHVLQNIYAMGMRMEVTQRKSPPVLAEHLGEMIANLNTVIRDIRVYISGAPQYICSYLTFKAEIENRIKVAEGSSAPRFEVDIEPSAFAQLTAAESEQVLNIAREAISNAMRHSHARLGVLALRAVDGGVTVEIADDGMGFDRAAYASNDGGLCNMDGRARQIGASLGIFSTPGGGARIAMHIPKRRTSAN